MLTVFGSLKLECCGHRPARNDFLAQYPEIAEELSLCLEGIDFLHQTDESEGRAVRVAGGRVSALATLGDFRISHEVGRGGMGVVYEAEQLSIGRRVVLKVLPFAALLSDRQARRFKNEARALNHPHEVGIVHRDIKPSNLLTNGAGHVWVADFGLAMSQTDVELTVSGDLLGTLRYMSPEQASGQRGVLDHRTDIYSLGLALLPSSSYAAPQMVITMVLRNPRGERKLARICRTLPGFAEMSPVGRSP